MRWGGGGGSNSRADRGQGGRANNKEGMLDRRRWQKGDRIQRSKGGRQKWGGGGVG